MEEVLLHNSRRYTCIIVTTGDERILADYLGINGKQLLA
jgi:hypothetical protein